MSANRKIYSDLCARQKRSRAAEISARRRALLEGDDAGNDSEECSSNESAENLDRVQLLMDAPAPFEDYDEVDENVRNLRNDVGEAENVPEVYDNVANVVNGNGVLENNENDIVIPALNVAHERRKLLKNFCLQSGLNHSQQKQLLKTLRGRHFHLHDLPKDSRTLQNTPTIVVRNLISEIGGGEYLHLGFKELLEKQLLSLPEDSLPEFLHADLSTDGGQLYRSGGLQFWPLQFRVANIKGFKPLVAGVYVGETKPSNSFELFEQLVAEMREIFNDGGLTIRNRDIPLLIRCFIGDAPARSFVLNHKGHTAAHACSKCKVVGHRCTTPGFESMMSYLCVNHERRTDDEYRARTDEDHHKGPSILSPFIGLVSKVPVECMHLVYLGAVKRKLEGIFCGKFGQRRLNARKVDILDSRIFILRDYCPSEFQRKLGPLSQFNRYKATQFRQLLLYVAPALFCNVLDEGHFQHFMLLHTVMRFLSFENQSEDILHYCQEAIETYVTICEALYGPQFIVYNVHSLLHLVDNVRELGLVESFSAFCFENSMPSVRNMSTVRPRGVLEQLYKRMQERSSLVDQVPAKTIATSGKHCQGPLCGNLSIENCEQFRNIEISGITLSKSLRNCCCLLKNSEICIIRNVVRIQDDFFLLVRKFSQKSRIFDVGYSSEAVGVYSCGRLSTNLSMVPLRQVDRKCFIMPKWSSVEGEEEEVVEDEFVCVNFITSVEFT